MSDLSLVQLFAKLFIARPDVVAVQTAYNEGGYKPLKVGDKYIPWDAEMIQSHIDGTQTFGHYLLNTDSTCKLFAFDIDLDTEGMLPGLPFPDEDDPGKMLMWESSFVKCNPREEWKNRAHPARPYMKAAMRSIAHCIERAIADLHVPTAVTYTGNKGMHVYGFTGRMPAEDVRTAADVVIDSLPLVANRGHNFYKWNTDAVPSAPRFEEHELFTIEVFPKQTSIKPDSFGNLMRLPLGRNLKSEDPTFFVDTTRPFGELAPADPLETLRNVDANLLPS